MRKKNLWRNVIVVSMCSAMIFATPVVHASDVDAVVEESTETAEETVAPTVTCDQTVLNGKDDVTLHFDLGSAGKVTSLCIWLRDVDGVLSPVYSLPESSGFYAVDYEGGVATVNSKAVYDHLYNYGGVNTGDLNGVKIGLGLMFDDGSYPLGGELTIQDGDQTTPDGGDGGQTTPDGNTDGQTPDGNTDAGQTTPDGQTPDGNTDGQTPDAGQTTPDQTQKPEVKPVAPNTTQTQISATVENTSSNPKTGDVTGFAGLMGTGLSSLGVATTTLLRKRRRK